MAGDGVVTLPPGMTPRRRRKRLASTSAAVAVALFAGPLVPDATAGANATGGGRVAVVLVPDLMWSSAPPVLDAFAKSSLVMRTAEASSGDADVYLTLGKGARSGGFVANGYLGPFQPLPGGGMRLVNWAQFRDQDRRLTHPGTLGTVGQALLRADRRWAFAGDDLDAAATAATADGTVPVVFPGGPDGVRRALTLQPDALFVATSTPVLPVVLDELRTVCTLVASGSTPNGNRQLGVLAASPSCDLGAGGLRSGSTQRPNLATLADVSATVLDAAGVVPPSSVSGLPVTAAGAVSRTDLVNRDTRTSVSDRWRTPLTWLFVAAHAVGAALVVWCRRSRMFVCCVLLSIPAASFLMMAVPWWRHGIVGGLMVGAGLTAAIAAAGLLATRREPLLGIALLAGITAATIGIDALFKSPLQVDAPFGNSPVVAGRFFGIGNIGSGFLVAGLVTLAGVALHRWSPRSRPWVVASLALAVVVGGAPQFGADVGGVLFAVPAYAVLLLSYPRRPLVPRRALFAVAAVGAAAVAAVGLAALVDASRDATSQSHLARTLRAGEIGDVIARKAERAVQTLKAPMANVIVIAAAALALVRFRLPSSTHLRFAACALFVAAVVGSLVNDSGANVGAAVAAIGWPFAVAVHGSSPPVSSEEAIDDNQRRASAYAT